MIDLAALLPGQFLWSVGTNVYGDGKVGGMFVGEEASADGERLVVILSDSAQKPRQASLILHHPDGRRRAYEQLGLVSRLVRLPVSDIDPTAATAERFAGKVWDYARKALIAASLPPNHHLGSRGHNELIACYHLLRDTATMLGRGVE